MASFTPLNVESDDSSDEEIDFTKELQIEDALKAYYNALKLHSQGPAFYKATEAAYNELFKSEIFTYPEGLSLSRQVELFGDEEESDEEDETTLAAAPPNVHDGAPSSLPQILYLSYKNHAQFILDVIRDVLEKENGHGSNYTSEAMRSRIHAALSRALPLMIEAVDRDETDLFLWRQISRISRYLGSQAVARFCLESVTSKNQDVLESWPEPLGVEEAFAMRKLMELLYSIGDSDSVEARCQENAPVSGLMKALQQHSDPCPFLPTSGNVPGVSEATFEHSTSQLRRRHIAPLTRTWTSCGQAILEEVQAVKTSDAEIPFGTSYLLTLPPAPVKVNSRLDQGGHGNHQRKNEGERNDCDLTTEDALKVGIPERSAESEVTKDDTMPLSAEAETSPIGSGVQVSPDLQNKDGELQLVSPKQQEAPARTLSLPTRKRSVGSAGLPDNADAGRVKSKRIKARTSLNESTMDPDVQAAKMTQRYENELAERNNADTLLFEHLDKGLSALCTDISGALEDIRALHRTFDHGNGQSKTSPMEPASFPVAWQDLVRTLNTWDSGKNQAFLRKDSTSGPLLRPNSFCGLAAILKDSQLGSVKHTLKPSLSDSVRLDYLESRVNSAWLPLESIAVLWIEQLLGSSWTDSTNQPPKVSAYHAYVWPEELREALRKMLVTVDRYLFIELRQRVDTRILRLSNAIDDTDQSTVDDIVHLVQNILECHVDIYGTMAKAEKACSADDLESHRISLLRWHALAMDAFATRHNQYTNENTKLQDLDLRFLWSTVVKNKLIDPIAGRRFSLKCFQDLAKTIQQAIGDTSIILPNSTIMPEICSAVAKQEIASLSTMDFFEKLFDPSNDDPVIVIESLEPLLDRFIPPDSGEQPTNEHLVHFLDTANISFKLILWQRLTDAYAAIDYSPGVFACNFEQIALILELLSSQQSTDLPNDQRIFTLLQRLRDLNDLTASNLTIAVNEPEAFELLDDRRLRTAIVAVVKLINLLHVSVLWEDSVSVGQISSPRLSSSQAAAFAHSKNRLHDMVVRSWLLQFFLWKELILHFPESSSLKTQDLTWFLSGLHAMLGFRQSCGSSNRIFLELLKAELLKSRAFEDWETELSQIIYDLHGINISLNSRPPQPHGCGIIPLDRGTATGLLDLVIAQANRLSMKELCKSDLRNTIERMHEIIKGPKSTTSSMYNKRLISGFLKGPINPVNLYKSLHGIGGLGGITVHNESAHIANKGWYFLLGHFSLAKFRGQKRVASIGSIEELENAISYFKQDLELDTERWETWYRLGQAYDAKIDEYVSWSAEKINTCMEDLKTFQRNAIHCYTMAVAIANRNADASFENVEKLSELYADFGNRIYASTREPLADGSQSIRAFSLEPFVRHFSAPEGMYVKRPFRELQLYPAWQFAATLLRRSLAHKPKVWTNHYMLGKCLWKMRTAPGHLRGTARQISTDEVITALAESVQALPIRDNRHPDKEPILEPHHKLVSIIHKLVQRGDITPRQGCEYLTVTCYSKKISAVEELHDWSGYAFQLLKVLRDADKSGWHHRIVARAAHVIYDQGAGDIVAASNAKQQMMSQIFTKTMMIQVWRPEKERAGRHFVYTSRYVNFIIRLCVETKDRPNLEALAKQIRKKAAKFHNHLQVWQFLCTEYLRLLRSEGRVRWDLEADFFKSMNLEAFTADAERVDTWAHMKGTQHPLLDVLREAVELKRLNNSLLKPATFDDLIVDVYATIFKEKAPELAPPSVPGEKDTVMSVNNIILDPNMQLTAGAPPPSDLAMDSAGTPGDYTSVRPRSRGVTKREVQRRAETLVITVNKHWNDKLPKDESSKPTNAAKLAYKNDEGKDGASSVPGSVHDSADDESELSDLEEMPAGSKIKQPMFPNLMMSRDDDETQTEDGTMTEDGNARESSPTNKDNEAM